VDAGGNAYVNGADFEFVAGAAAQAGLHQAREDFMRIAVTGAAGRLGGQVARLLAAEEAHQVVALTRRPMPPGRQLANATMVTADYGDPAALRAALRGIEVLVFISSDGEAARVLLHHQNVVRAAADAGVAHVVALSGLDADVGSPFCYAHTYAHTEQILSDSRCPVSIARASIFTEFFLRFLTQARATGQIRVPAGAARISLVSRADVGRCLAALATGAPTGRHHDLTGPEALDLPALALLCEQQWAVPVAYINLTPASYCADLALAGEDPWWLYAFSTMFASVRQHRWAAVSAEVARLTGRTPVPVQEILSQHRQA
jgi:NAD(P)H dehydrogenase (quinone)